MRPYVIPFLKLHLPILQSEINHLAKLSKLTPSQYLRQHESLILDLNVPSANSSASEHCFEIFQPNEALKENHLKRKSPPEM